ncbi:hypothetical protein AAHH80_38525, partial [Burkholderia pseudomallei]
QQLLKPVPHDPFNAINYWAPHYALHGSRPRPVAIHDRTHQTLKIEPAQADHPRRADRANLSEDAPPHDPRTSDGRARVP